MNKKKKSYSSKTGPESTIAYLLESELPYPVLILEFNERKSGVRFNGYPRPQSC